MFNLSKLIPATFSPTITDMIRMDHNHVLLAFHQYRAQARPRVKQALTETICTALDIHATLEEEIFYPVMRQLDETDAVTQKSKPEHDDMRALMARLGGAHGPQDERDRLLMELMQIVIHHVADEETVLLPRAERLLGKERLRALGAQMTRRRLQLAAPKMGKIVANSAVGFSGSTGMVLLAVAATFLAGRYLAAKS